MIQGSTLTASPSAGMLPSSPALAQSGPNTVKSKAGNASEIYGSFYVDESEFAIPVSAVQEVVNEPDAVSPVPLSPDFMRGLFNLRGMIIPVVDLRKLLGFPQWSGDQKRKVAIIEYGEHCIGLLFDRTGEVLTEQDAARVDFGASEGGAKHAVVDGVLKFEQGDRLVQLLDPYELLKLDKVPRADHKSERVAAKTMRGKRWNCISFQTGYTSCALDLRYVKEVREMPEVDQSLFARGNIIGTTNLRGVIVPVIDFRAYMGDDAQFNLGKTMPKGRKMLVIETVEGPVGLMVFSVDSIMPYFEDDVLPFAKLALPRGEFIQGCLIDEEKQIIMMLDEKELRGEPTLVAAAKACQELFPPETQEQKITRKQVNEKENARRTFIRFTFERTFALDTTCVSEVIDRPDDILEPPYALSFVEGIINLRGELITLINPRALYGLKSETREEQKVLIFLHQGSKYGIMIDTVDEIIMTTDAKVLPIQPMDQQGSPKNIIEDVKACLQHKVPQKALSSILILDAGALVDRCLESVETL